MSEQQRRRGKSKQELELLPLDGYGRLESYAHAKWEREKKGEKEKWDFFTYIGKSRTSLSQAKKDRKMTWQMFRDIAAKLGFSDHTQLRRVLAGEAGSQKSANYFQVTATGSEGTVEKGCGIALGRHGSRNPVWVRSPSTLILGCHPDGPEHESQRSGVSWSMNIPIDIWSSAIDARLIIACDRTYGGLHSGTRSKKARIMMNDRIVDELELLVRSCAYKCVNRMDGI